MPQAHTKRHTSGTSAITRRPGVLSIRPGQLVPVYGPGDTSTEPPSPGEFPFTRGNFVSGYQGKLWTFRQYSGLVPRRNPTAATATS